METVLITGAAGFIGSHLTRFLINKNIKPHLLVRKSSSLWRINDILKNVFIHYGNIEDKNSIDRIIKIINPDSIYHLASFGVTDTGADKKRVMEANVSGTFHLMEACLNKSIKSFVYTGTCFEYGNEHDRLINEKDQPNPSGFYGVSKLMGTEIVRHYANKFNFPAVIVRPFTTYGPFEDSKRLIPATILSILRNEQPRISANNPVRDFIFVYDTVNGLILSSEKAKRFRGEIFNLSTGKELTVSEIVHKIAGLLNKNIKPANMNVPKYSNDNYHWKADYSKAKNKLGFAPKTSIDKGLKITVDWFIKNIRFYS